MLTLTAPVEQSTSQGMQYQHSLAAPVVALDEPLALAVCRVAAERSGHVGAGRAVVVLDQRVDLKAFEIGELGAGVIGHGVTVATIGRVFVRREQVTRGRQAETTSGAAAQHHRLGAEDQESRWSG